MKRIVILLSMLALAVGTLLAVPGAASAGTAPKTTGSVQLEGPTQYVSFDAFQTNPVKGSVSYTNFTYEQAGTGVWLPSGTFGLDLMYLGTGPYSHTLTVTGFMPTSPTSVVFWGTGFYDPDPTWTESFSGTVSGSSFDLTLIPDDGGAKYGWTVATFTGTIASDGAISGTWSDSLGRVDTFSSSDAVHEVFHYVAPVTSVVVAAPTATFTYVIPAGVDFAGTTITMVVNDGGSPGTKDTFLIQGAPYQIVAGNLTVFA